MARVELPIREKDGLPDFPSNSNKSKQEQQETEASTRTFTKITDGKAVKKSKPIGRRIAETFIGDDVDSVWQYILWDVVVPAAKTTISDAVSSGIEMLLFGETRRRPANISRNRGESYVSYSKYYADKDRQSNRPRLASERRAYLNDEIILESRSDAENVLDTLADNIDRYGVTSVADLYQLVGIQSQSTDNRYGWEDLRQARVQRTRDGYLLDLPKARPID